MQRLSQLLTLVVVLMLSSEGEAYSAAANAETTTERVLTSQEQGIHCVIVDDVGQARPVPTPPLDAGEFWFYRTQDPAVAVSKLRAQLKYAPGGLLGLEVTHELLATVIADPEIVAVLAHLALSREFVLNADTIGMLGKLTQVRSLWIEQSVTAEDLHALLGAFPGLEIIRVRWESADPNAVMDVLGRHKTLNRVHALISVAGGGPGSTGNLRDQPVALAKCVTIELSGDWILGEKSIAILARSTRLRELSLIFGAKAQCAPLAGLRESRSLAQVVVRVRGPLPNLPDLLGNVRSQVVLDLAGSEGVVDDSLTSIPGSLTFTELVLDGCDKLAGYCFRSLLSTHRVMKLSATNCFQLTAASVSGLLEHSYLEELDLSGCFRVNCAVLGTPSSTSRLRRLVLQSCMIEDTLLKRLAACSMLEGIDITDNQRVTDEGIAAIIALPSLRHLAMASLPLVSDTAICGIRNSRIDVLLAGGAESRSAKACKCIAESNVRVLSLAGCAAIDDDGIAQLATSSSLVSVDVSSCPKLTAEGLRAMAKVGNLRFLSAANCESLAVAGLEPLCSLKQLHSVVLVGSRGVSSEDISRLAKCLPGCKVAF